MWNWCFLCLADCPSDSTFRTQIAGPLDTLTVGKHQTRVSLIGNVYPPSHLIFQPELCNWNACITSPTPIQPTQNCRVKIVHVIFSDCQQCDGRYASLLSSNKNKTRVWCFPTARFFRGEMCCTRGSQPSIENINPTHYFQVITISTYRNQKLRRGRSCTKRYWTICTCNRKFLFWFLQSIRIHTPMRE